MDLKPSTLLRPYQVTSTLLRPYQVTSTLLRPYQVTYITKSWNIWLKFFLKDNFKLIPIHFYIRKRVFVKCLGMAEHVLGSSYYHVA